MVDDIFIEVVAGGAEIDLGAKHFWEAFFGKKIIRLRVLLLLLTVSHFFQVF